MHWLKPNLRNSILGLLSPPEFTASVFEDRTDSIRQIMLESMGEFGEKHYPKIMHRVRFAEDPQGLWYARGDVMAVLAAMQGETVARKKVGAINSLFRGLLPRSLASRASWLTS